MKTKEKKRNFAQAIVTSFAISVLAIFIALMHLGGFLSSFVSEYLGTSFSLKTGVVSHTTLEIENTSEFDSVLTYLTIGSDTNFVTDVKGVFGIKDSGLQGSFWLLKDSVYTYEFDNKGLSGNFSFDTVPLNCPAGSYDTGTNLFEVTLNNYGTIDKAQETIDISNVAGVNAICRYTMSGGGTWIAGGNPVSSFGNSSMYNNLDSVGVFPYGCDNCTESVLPPKCIDTLKIAKPQRRHICNVSRNAKQAGGKVRITFTGFTP